MQKTAHLILTLILLVVMAAVEMVAMMMIGGQVQGV